MSGPLMDSIARLDPARHSPENRDQWAQVRATLTDRDSVLAKGIDETKMAAFYVDFDDDKVLVPNDRVDRGLAQSMINAVSRAITYAP
jgi:AbiV family abortive infection protein